MSIVYEHEWEGYRIKALPVERYDVSVETAEGELVAEFDATDVSLEAAWRQAEDLAADHRDRLEEEERGREL